MKYCTKCGAELLDEAVICPNCGCAVENNQNNSERNTLGLIAKVFMIISCVVMGFYLIPLAWCIPMTIEVSNRLKRHEPIGTGLKVCTLIFVNIISGILLLCMNDNNN